MHIVRNAIFASVMAGVAAFAAADTGLLNYVMQDAKIVSGIHVDAAKTSTFGKYVLSQMQIDDVNFQKFVADTQFDPRRDLSEIVISTGGTADNPTVLVAGRGTFNPGAIMTAAINGGATKITYGNIDVLTHPMDNSRVGAVAFLDAGTAVMGSLPAVQAAIDRRGASASLLPQSLLGQISALSLNNDAWFLSTGPVTDFFAGKVADPNLQGAMAGNLLQAVQQASGGIKFNASDVLITGQALARSPKDAEALRDVVKFVAGLVQLNRDSTPESQKVASLVDKMTVTAQDSTMQLTLSIPEEIMRELFMPQANRPAAKVRNRKTASIR